MINSLPYLAITMGLMSSVHCIGMCGPIALALPIQKGSKFQKLAGLLAYNTGRALTYSFLGSLIGAFGSTLALLGCLKYLSFAVGVVMLLYVIWPSRLNLLLHTPKFWQHAVNRLKQQMSDRLKSKKASAWIGLGILNGLLPCGLVYIALISSVATGSIHGSAIYMLLFGIGTLPAMMAVGFFRDWFTPALRSRFHKVVPALIAVAGIWLIFRSVLIEYPATTSPGSAPITICHGV